MRKGFASTIFIMLGFLFIILQSFYFLISKTQSLALITIKRMQKSTMTFKEHYKKLKNGSNMLAKDHNIITIWGERQIITPCQFDGKKWIARYEDTYVK
jgi:hypothetical protein